MNCHRSRNKMFLLLIIIMILMALFSSCGGRKEAKKKEVQQEHTQQQKDIKETVPVLISEPLVNDPEAVYIPGDENNINTEGIDSELREILALADDYREMAQNSTQKIEKDLVNGKITRDDASKLSIFAAYDPERLPEKYKSQEPSGSAQFEIKYLINNWDSLSESTKEAVEPYILPITDTGSFFHPEYSDKVSKTGQQFSFVSSVYAAEEPLYIFQDIVFTHDGQEFTISYIEYSTWSDELKKTISQMAETVEESVKHSWNKFMPLMKEKPSMPFLIELLDMTNPKSTIYGEQFDKNGKYQIRINYIYGANEKIVKSTTAHELFHSFQDELGIGFEDVDEKWLCEETAVWSENFAYEELNFEHSRHNGFFRTLEKDRINFGNNFEYFSYMLFYYLTDYANVNFIRDIIVHSADNGSSSIRPYLEDNIPNLKDSYARFALFNWNRKPFNKYYDHGRISGNPNGKCLKKKVMGVDEEDEVTVTLQPGAIKYYYYVFDQRDEYLKHINLSFNSPLADDQYVKRQALLKIDGKWITEDISSARNKKYCYRRKSRKEKVEAMVLIYSNASFQDMMVDIDTFKVSTEGCPKEMELLITAEYTYQTNDFLWKSTAELSETLEIIDHCLFFVKESEYDFSGNGIYEGEPIIYSEGSFSVSIDEPDIKNSMARILKKTAENIPELGKAYEKYGIKDNIPEQGIIITIPAPLEGQGLSGKTILYMPEPVGTISFPNSLPFDGLSQLIAFTPKPQHWNYDGIKTSIVVNPYEHKCPLTSAFTFETDTFINNLESVKDMVPKGMPALEDLEGIELPGSGGLDNFEFGLEGESFEEDSSLESIDALIEALSPNQVAGSSITVEIEVEGMYTEYYK